MRSLVRRETLRLAETALERTLEALVAFLRAERFAVATYEAAAKRIRVADVRDELGRLRTSHAARALILVERVNEFAEPGVTTRDEPVEPWGAFAQANAQLERATNDRDVLCALRIAESWLLRDYEIDLNDVDANIRRQLVRMLLGEQKRCRKRLLRWIARLRGESGSDLAFDA